MKLASVSRSGELTGELTGVWGSGRGVEHPQTTATEFHLHFVPSARYRKLLPRAIFNPHLTLHDVANGQTMACRKWN